ncbi:MAG: transglycosylase SLT domain-containing protein [Gammaproteobacteria bacterium]
MSIRGILFCWLLFLPLLTSAVDREQQRNRFKEAYDFIQSQKEYDLANLSKGLKTYPLYPYLQFAHLYADVAHRPVKQMDQFLAKNSGTPLAKRLRKRWLYSLARRKQWDDFLQRYKPDQAETILRCYQLQARINTAKVNRGLLEDIKKMWLVGKSQAAECDPAFKVLYSSKVMTSDLVWNRIRLAMKNNNPRLAKHLSKRLNKKDQKIVLRWRAVASDPDNNLLHSDLKKDTSLNREIILYGLKKLANRDTLKTYSVWNKINEQYKFSPSEKNSIEREIAFTAVQQDLLRAGKWLDKLQTSQSDQYIQRYLIRYATRNQDWEKLRNWTKKEPAAEFNKLRWQYWRARAFEETGSKKAADLIYKHLAKNRDYYGFLAAERAGLDYRFHDKRLPLTDAQRAKLLARPALARAEELYALEMFQDARREWQHGISKMNRVQLQQVAVLADEWGWHDRTILTLGKAKSYDDLTRRFPLPYNKTVKKYSKKRALPVSKIYTIIRQESAFIHDVRSHAGALGLMQVMPATGKQTAKKIGYKYKNSRQLYDPTTNIAIGTAYLKEMLQRYDGNLIMAAAAYNAGPHRVKRWRPDEGCMPGELWAETIPFTETRRYVRRALFYSVLYQWRLKEKIKSVQSQLKLVPALEASCS